GRPVGKHHSRERVGDSRDEGGARREAQTKCQRPRPPESPQDVKEVVKIERSARRKKSFEKQGRVEQRRVGVRERRFSARGRCIDEGSAPLLPGLHRHAPPGPVRDLRIAKHEPPRAEGFRQEGQRKKSDCDRSEDEKTEARGHRLSLMSPAPKSGGGFTVIRKGLGTLSASAHRAGLWMIGAFALLAVYFSGQFPPFSNPNELARLETVYPVVD